MANSKYPWDFKYFQDKSTIFEFYCKYVFTRTQSMFVYEGLPDTIPVQWLEQYLQMNGSCAIAKVGDDLYALSGTAGGELDPYYQPTLYTVANPALKLSATYHIGKDCVYARNDYSAIGLGPLISRYCGLLTENVLTIRQADISMRNMFLLSAPDDNTLQSTKQFLIDLENGKLGVIADSPFFDGVKMQSSTHGTGDYMIQFIELQQYIKGSLYNELGLNANYNMKREALSGDEIAMNDDALMPLIDDMLKQRRQMCSDIKDIFGIEVSVDYGSTWHSNVVEKQVVADSEYNATSGEASEMAGDESNLPDDSSAQDVSQLNEATDSSEDSESVEDSDDIESNDDSNGKQTSTENPSNDPDDDISKESDDTYDDEQSSDNSSVDSESNDKDDSDNHEGEPDSKEDQDVTDDSNNKSDDKKKGERMNDSR